MAACVTVLPEPGTDRQNSPLKLAYSPWIGYFPMAIAQEKGFFQAQGVNVQLFYDEGESSIKFASGQYDGVVLALGNLVRLIPQNSNIRIVAVIDQSNGADAVVSQSQIETVSELRGKTIGVRLGSFGELFVNRMLQFHGLTPEEVMLNNVFPESMLDFLNDRYIEAAHLWQPTLSQAVAAGYRVLFTSAETPGLIPDVMAFQKSVLAERPEDVKAVLRAWFQAVEYWQTHLQEGNAVIAKVLNLKPEEISLEGVQLFNAVQSRQAFIKSNSTASLYYTSQLYSDFALQAGNMTRPIDIEQLLEPTFLPPPSPN